MSKKLGNKLFFIIAFLSFTMVAMEKEIIEGEREDNNSALSGFYLNDYQLPLSQYHQIVNLNQRIKQSPLFRTSNLKNDQWRIAERDALGGEEVQLQTQDGCLITCWHFKRGKDKVILAAPGFGGGFEEVMPLLEIYADYDVMLLEYWGHGSHDALDKSKTKWYRNPAQRFFSERFQREHFDALAALEYLRGSIRNAEGETYKEVIASGVCYSTLVFAKVQSMQENDRQKGFDKLIFDSSWLSMQAVAEKVVHDPYLSFDQIRGGAPAILRTIMNAPYLESGLLSFSQMALGIDLEQHTILDHIGTITCPVLFIQGNADKLVTQEEFTQIVENCNAPKAILKTPFPHFIGMLKGKEIYKCVVNLFLNDQLTDEEINVGEVIERHIETYQFSDENMTHTPFIIRPQTAKLLSIKNSLVAMITLIAGASVWYILAGANNASVNTTTVDLLQ